MPDAGKYHLRVSAGPAYEESQHQLVNVNTNEAVRVKSDSIDASVRVRVQNYRGIPKSSPETSAYFSHDPHTSDLYSISFSFRLPSSDPISGNDLLFGNDFEHPIKDKLPPGFGTALRIVRWAIDPGLDGDVYADKPYLYGPLLSSINVLRIGPKEGEQASSGDSKAEDEIAAVTEGGVGSGEDVRKEKGLPDVAGQRMKHFLDESKRKAFTFEPGRDYECDFFNPYLDFNEFSLKLPGFTLPIIRYWDGQPLRYVLKHKTADQSVDKPLLVIVFQLVSDDQSEDEEQKWKGGTISGDGSKPKAGEPSREGTGAVEDKRFVDDDVD